MRYILTKRFEKDFVKLPKRVKEQVIAALVLFVENPRHSSLRVHPLKGKWVGHYSIDITGDMRAVYFIVERDLVRFVAVGSHSQLYG
jgi:addiction module RelE/StbE family toxin